MKEVAVFKAVGISNYIDDRETITDSQWDQKRIP
jgi:hypothetical protein